MEVFEKLEAYFEKEDPFKEGINVLRDIAMSTIATETFKWGSPVYTTAGKNVFWITRFKKHFSLGFFNGFLLKDPKNFLINNQEGKTHAMRHWKFTSLSDIDEMTVKAYMVEAIENQNKGLVLLPKQKKKKVLDMPKLLGDALDSNARTKEAFIKLTAYKQRDYMEYISTAKQERTKLSRLAKILPMIDEGIGLNDKYRNC